jgi:hypothetical protein
MFSQHLLAEEIDSPAKYFDEFLSPTLHPQSASVVFFKCRMKKVKL